MNRLIALLIDGGPGITMIVGIVVAAMLGGYGHAWLCIGMLWLTMIAVAAAVAIRHQYHHPGRPASTTRENDDE